MAVKTIWKDVDFSMERNIYNDVGIITNESAVTNALINRITIADYEMFFYDKSKTTINDYLHQSLDFVAETSIKDTIQHEALKDSRIISLTNIVVEEDALTNKLEMSMDAKIRMLENKDVKLQLAVERQ